jgi:predicted Zn finger-like uncharacterized protein
MMIHCPYCDTPYFAADDIDQFGQMVRCDVCGTRWLARSFENDPFGHEVDRRLSASPERPDIVDAVVIEQIGPGFKLPPFHHGRAGRPRTVIGGGRKSRRLKATGAILSALVAAIVLRATIVAALPDLSATAAIAAGYDNLDLRSVKSETLRIGTADTLLVEGEIVNRSDRDVLLPAVRVSLKGENGQEVFSWLVEPAMAGLAPGKSIGFRSALASPPPGASRVTLNLATREGQTIGLH